VHDVKGRTGTYLLALEFLRNKLYEKKFREVIEYKGDKLDFEGRIEKYQTWLKVIYS
jgi:hypothetical protein